MLLSQIYMPLGDSRLRTIDYSQWLQEGESVASVISQVTPVTTPALTVVAQVLSTTEVSILVSDGAADETYAVEIEITTDVTLPNVGNTGQTKSDCIGVTTQEVCTA